MDKISTIYSSSNGDRWLLVRDGTPARFMVRHEPNMSSGGQATETPAEEFLRRNSATPQGEALQAALNKLGAIDPDLEK